MLPGKTYNAFISYSQSDQIAALGFKTALEKYAKAWYRQRSIKTFLDTTNLEATPALWSSVQKGINQSEYFILIASPASAKSRWVNQEIKEWISNNPTDKIIIVKLKGQIIWNNVSNDFDHSESNALPFSLLGCYTQEPLIIDISGIKEFTISDSEYELAVARVSARIRAMPLDKIKGEHVKRKKQLKQVISLVSVVLSGLILLTLLLVRKNIREIEERKIQENIAHSRNLAAQSEEALKNYDSEKALSLAYNALKTSKTIEAQSAFLDVLVLTKHLQLDVLASEYMIDCIGLDPKGKFFVTGDQAGTVCFFDIKSGKVLKKYEDLHPLNGVRAIDISDDGSMIASGGGENGEFILWETSNFDPVIRLEDASCNSIKFLPGNTKLLVGRDRGIVLVWNIQEQKVENWYAVPGDGIITDLTILPEKSWFVTGSLYGIVRIRNLETLKPIMEIDPAPSTGTTVDINIDGSIIMMAGASAVQFWDVVENEPYNQPLTSNKSISIARFKKDNSNEAILILGNELYESVGNELVPVGFHKDDIVSMDFNPINGQIITGAKDGRVRIWSLEPGNDFAKYIMANDNNLSPNIATISPDGLKIAVSSSDYHFNFSKNSWNYSYSLIQVKDVSGLHNYHHTKHNGMIFDMFFLMDEMVAFVSADNTLNIWNLGNDSTKVINLDNEGTLYEVAFSPNGQYLAYTRHNQNVKILELDEDREIQIPNSGNARTLTYTNENDELLLGTSQGEILSWEMGKKNMQTVYKFMDEKPVSELVYSSKSKKVLVLIDQKVLLVPWPDDTADTMLLDIHDARSIAAGDNYGFILEFNNRLTMWNLTNAQYITELNPGYESQFIPGIKNVACSNDGLKVIITMESASQVFNLDKNSLSSRASEISGNIESFVDSL